MLDSGSSSLIDSFISDSRAHADRICIVDSDGNRIVASGPFVRMADSYIRLLRSKGVCAGDVVAIGLDRKAEHIAAFFACMSMGCPFVITGIDCTGPDVERLMGS